MALLEEACHRCSHGLACMLLRLAQGEKLLLKPRVDAPSLRDFLLYPYGFVWK